MQSDKNGIYQSSVDCAFKVIRKDGLKGLLIRGLDATLAREIPGYGLYFVVYSVLMTSAFGLALGPNFAPLVCGAAAGCLSWIPVFPFDVVKTYVQQYLTQYFSFQFSSSLALSIVFQYSITMSANNFNYIP